MSSKFTDSQPTIELKVNSPTANVGITDAEYNIRLNPDVEADIFATKTELSAVENKIPAEYVKSAAVADNKLTLTKQDNTVVEFEGGGSYTLPVASTTTLGGVKPDGTTTTVDEDGTIHAHDTTPIATTTTVGSVKPDGTTITIDSNGVITANIPTKTSDLTNDSDFITTEYHDSTKQDKLVAGNNITISANNVISATGGGGGGGSYTLPVASTTTLGGVKVGNDNYVYSYGGRYVYAEEDGRLYVPLPNMRKKYPGVVIPGKGLKLSGFAMVLDTPSKGANGKYSIGGVKPDETTTTVDEDGTIHAHTTIPVATTTTVGSVKPDGTTITIDSNGVISSQTAGAIYKTLPQGSLGDYLKNPVNKAWVIDWANNPDKYIVDVDGCKVIITNKYGSTFYYYYYKSGGASSYYYIYFTDNNFTEISSNQPGWSIADTQYLNESNWQNYITGISPWQNTTNTLDSNLYNAKEVVIFWKDSQDNYHQTYLNVECDRWGNHGSTWGSSDWLNTQIYLDKWDEYNGASITYDGSNVNASNCYIYSICYKT